MSLPCVGLHERCESRCPGETKWSQEAKKVSSILRLQGAKTRCVLRCGHKRDHLGPDESQWEESEKLF